MADKAKTVNDALAVIQATLKAPKGQFNSFGKYKYRSCEDILEAVKPLLKESTLTLSDDVVEIGGRVYVKAKASFGHNGAAIDVTAFARESETKKGMDDSQITGTASSYARKYALNGLFLIDDTKDADTDEHAGNANSEPAKISDDQAVEIVDLIAESGADEKRFLAFFKVPNVPSLSVAQYRQAVSMLKAKLK